MSTGSRHTPWPLGCQARPWLQTLGRDTIGERLPEVMKAIADCGFRGFETAIDVLPLTDPEAFAAARKAAGGITLAGAHAGGKWWSADSAATIPTLLSRVSQLPALGCERVVVSMGPPDGGFDTALIQAAVENLRQFGQGCREHGVALTFHNHAAELAHNAQFFDTLVEQCTPEEVGLGTDLGWVAFAGTDPVDFIKRYASHLAYLHVRDLTTEAGVKRFTEVGRGDFDYSAIFTALQAIGYQGWLTAESEFNDHWGGLTEPAATASAQFAGLTTALANWSNG